MKDKIAIVLIIIIFYIDNVFTFLSHYFYKLRGKKAFRVNFFLHKLWVIFPRTKELSLTGV